jgi:hypothetical protein
MRGILPLLFGQVAIHNWNSQWSQVSILYQNIEALYKSPHIFVPFSYGTKSQLFIFTWLKTVSISLCNVPGMDLVSCLMEPTGTMDGPYGQVNVTCPVGSTLSWSAHMNLSTHEGIVAFTRIFLLELLRTQQKNNVFRNLWNSIHTVKSKF